MKSFTELNEGFIYFVKNGKIDLVELPKFGSVKLTIQDGKIIQSHITTTKKH